MKAFLERLIQWISFIFNKKHDIITETETPEGDNALETSPEVEEHNEEQIPTEEVETYNYDILVLLDNGHASCTPGKRSPLEEGEEQFFEYEFNRDIVKRIAEKLKEEKIRYEILVPEVDEDIPLSDRAARANKWCDSYGKDKCLFISVHANAAGNGSKWMSARGWSCYTSKGETKSDTYAEKFMKEAEKILLPLGQKVRRYSSNKYSWEENYTVLVKTKCPAILSENLFYDNKQDIEFLRSEEGREAIAQIHVNTILDIAKNLGK